MLIKTFFKIVLGMALFACISSQSYAEDAPRSLVMRAVVKAAIEGGKSLASRTVFIVCNPIVAVDRFAGNVKTITGAVISQGKASLEAWGFLVDPYSGDGGEQGYRVNAIEKAHFLNSDSENDITAQDGQSRGPFLAAWFYGAVEPVIYYLFEQVSPNPVSNQPFLYGRPELQGAFNAVARYPARYPALPGDAPKFNFNSGAGKSNFNSDTGMFNFNSGN